MEPLPYKPRELKATFPASRKVQFSPVCHTWERYAHYRRVFSLVTIYLPGGWGGLTTPSATSLKHDSVYPADETVTKKETMENIQLLVLFLDCIWQALGSGEL